MVTVEQERRSGQGRRGAVGTAVVLVMIVSMIVGLLIGPEARIDAGDTILMAVWTGLSVLIWGVVLWLAREPDAGNRAAVGAVVIGALGVVSDVVFFFGFPLVLGVGAIMLGRDGLVRADAGAGRRGVARAGLVLGVVAVALWVAATAFVQEW